MQIIKFAKNIDNKKSFLFGIKRKVYDMYYKLISIPKTKRQCLACGKIEKVSIYPDNQDKYLCFDCYKKSGFYTRGLPSEIYKEFEYCDSIKGKCEIIANYLKNNENT